MSKLSENFGVGLEGHVLIKAYDSKDSESKVLLDKRNAIHHEHAVVLVAKALAGYEHRSIHSMHFGNGGTTTDPSGTITHNNPNATGDADLYSPIYFELVDDGTGAPQGNQMAIKHVAGTLFSDLEIRCIIDKNEPFGQAGRTFVFDEIGLKTADGTLITHVVFSPIEKSEDRIIEVIYTIRCAYDYPRKLIEPVPPVEKPVGPDIVYYLEWGNLMLAATPIYPTGSGFGADLDEPLPKSIAADNRNFTNSFEDTGVGKQILGTIAVQCDLLTRAGLGEATIHLYFCKPMLLNNWFILPENIYGDDSDPYIFIMRFKAKDFSPEAGLENMFPPEQSMPVTPKQDYIFNRIADDLDAGVIKEGASFFLWSPMTFFNWVDDLGQSITPPSPLDYAQAVSNAIARFWPKFDYIIPITSLNVGSDVWGGSTTSEYMVAPNINDFNTLRARWDDYNGDLSGITVIPGYAPIFSFWFTNLMAKTPYEAHPTNVWETYYFQDFKEPQPGTNDTPGDDGPIFGPDSLETYNTICRKVRIKRFWTYVYNTNGQVPLGNWDELNYTELGISEQATDGVYSANDYYATGNGGVFDSVAWLWFSCVFPERLDAVLPVRPIPPRTSGGISVDLSNPF